MQCSILQSLCTRHPRSKKVNHLLDNNIFDQWLLAPDLKIEAEVAERRPYSKNKNGPLMVPNSAIKNRRAWCWFAPFSWLLGHFPTFLLVNSAVPLEKGVLNRFLPHSSKRDVTNLGRSPSLQATRYVPPCLKQMPSCEIKNYAALLLCLK